MSSRYTLHHGEAREVLASFAINSIDAVVTDPPSGTNMVTPFQKSGDDRRYLAFDSPLGKLRYNFKTQNKVGLRLRTLFQENVWPVLAETYRTLKPGGYGAFWGFPRSLHWLMWGLENAGFAVLDVVVFEVPPRRMKTTIREGMSTTLEQRTELWALVRKPGEATATETREVWGTGFMRVEGPDGRVSNLLRVGRPRRVTSHPTEKPVSQMRELVRLLAPTDGLVLDPFMGSGATGKAALLEGLRFVGIERDPTFFDEARRAFDATPPRSASS